MIDTHCHLYLKDFDKDRESLITESVQAGVQIMLVPGIDFASSIKACDLSLNYAGIVYSAVGIHPNSSSRFDDDSFCNLINNYSDQIVAIGEIGLDYFRDFSSKYEQKYTFEKMLSLAQKEDLPICLHNRNSEDDLLDILSKWYTRVDKKASSTGVFHAYDGSAAIAEWAIDHGFFVGIGGMITYKKYDTLRERLKIIRLENIVIETDSPYLTPVPFRGKRNSPPNLIFIVEALATIFNHSIEEISQITDQNAMHLFGLNKNSR